MTTNFVGAEHEFHSKEFALGWAERFEPTPERLRLFELIFSQLKEAIPDDGSIVELGVGPGYLANYLLERMPRASYCGIDFSLSMLEIAQARLQRFSLRVTYTLHDLGSPKNINTVYERSYSALGNSGILINGDFIKPTGAIQEFEGGRFYVAKHLELLANTGFSNASCLSLFEEEIENPTPAQNYACIRAEK